MPPTDEEQSPPPSQPPAAPAAGKRRKTVIWYSVLAALVVVLLIPYVYTANPAACGLCHQMKPYVKSWRASTHARSARDCLTCHVAPGFANAFIYRMMFYREIYATVVGASLKPGLVTVPGVKSCQRPGCHSLNRISSISGDLIIDHRAHVLKGVPCTRCHPGAAHKGVGKLYLTPSKKMCKDCHADKMNDCPFCHRTIRGLAGAGAAAH
jgi:hypothetical protein